MLFPRILIGDILRPVRREGPLALFLAVAAECALITLFVMLSTSGESATIWNLFFVILNSTVFFGSFVVVALVVRGMETIGWQNLILADSLASKITSNPAAMRSALLKLQAKDLSGNVNQQGGEIAVGGDRRFWVKRLPMDMLQARVDNLTAIEQGHWGDFE